MALERELETYEQQLAGWLASGKEGRWVVIHGSDVLGFYATLDDAASAAYKHFGLSELFMVREVSPQRAPIQASRRAVHAHHQPGD
jgi:hypothetical protein